MTLPEHAQLSSSNKERLRKILEEALREWPKRDPRALATELIMQLKRYRES